MPFGVRGFDVIELTAERAQRRDGMAHEEPHAVGLAVLDELAREAVRVAGFVLCRVGRAGQLRPNVAQSRLDAYGFVDRDQPAVAAERAHLRGRAFGGRELLRARVEMQDALGA